MSPFKYTSTERLSLLLSPKFSCVLHKSDFPHLSYHFHVSTYFTCKAMKCSLFPEGKFWCHQLGEHRDASPYAVFLTSWEVWLLKACGPSHNVGPQHSLWHSKTQSPQLRWTSDSCLCAESSALTYSRKHLSSAVLGTPLHQEQQPQHLASTAFALL